MSIITKNDQKGERVLMMGNEAIARGALEAGVRVVAAYPGTPSSEIPTVLGEVSEERGLYVEWSANEKVSLEVASAGSYAGLRSLCTMKQVGVNVAADFLLHMAQMGTRAGMVLVTAEDPGFLSSDNEGDSRPYCKMMEFPMIEPSDFQEAKDMTKWAFELSESIHNVVMLRSVTRLSHASGNVVLGDLPDPALPEAQFDCNGPVMDLMSGPLLTPVGVDIQRLRQHAALKKAVEFFEDSPFNTYTGPSKPELLVITSSAATFYCKEAIDIMGIEDRVGLLKLATTWPLPPKLLEKHLASAKKVLVVEEGTPFLEDNIKTLFAEISGRLGAIEFFGKKDGTLPAVNEYNPDIVMAGYSKLLDVPLEKQPEEYVKKLSQAVEEGAAPRGLVFCPGCPHRATFWLLNEALTLDNKKGFVCGDIGCYSMGAAECGYATVKTLMAMGSGVGMASGFGKFGKFSFDQTAIAVCGDSTFFHAVLPGLVNAVHNESNMILVVLDNSGTAMTGFQPHPGTEIAADKKTVLPALDIPGICRAIGARVEIADPFNSLMTRQTIADLIDDTGGVRVLILKQPCALSPAKKGKKDWNMSVDQDKCISEDCGCNRLCTRVFKCPGLIWDPVKKKTSIDDFVCIGCGFCAQVCPQKAINIEKVV